MVTCFARDDKSAGHKDVCTDEPLAAEFTRSPALPGMTKMPAKNVYRRTCFGRVHKVTCFARNDRNVVMKCYQLNLLCQSSMEVT